MRGKQVGVFVASLGVLFIGNTAHAIVSGTTRVASGLSAPVFATYAPGDKNHLFVLEKSGNVKIVDLTTKTVLGTPFLNIPDTNASNEGGLLGMAFDPDYANPDSANKGKFYVYVTVSNPSPITISGGTGPSVTSAFSTHIRQYSVSDGNSLVADPTAHEVMSWARPEDNHVGGWIGFSPKNGYLYVDSGDGGLGNDSGGGHFEPGGNAQNITDLPNAFMGKQLRIDVHGDDFADANQNYAIPPSNPFVNQTGADEIWSYGLRNPFRASFDRDTGDMWIGDVGQDKVEEIDFEPAQRGDVSNYGWRLQEGIGATTTGGVGGPAPPNYVAPIYTYTHGAGTLQGNVVTGGYVYRGPDPSLQGNYYFADEGSNHRFVRDATTHVVSNIDSSLTPNIGSLANIASYAEDLVGNMYMVAYGSGSVFRMNTTQLLPGDYNADGYVDAADYTIWKDSYGQTGSGLAADGDGSLSIDDGDYTVWLNNFGTTVHTLLAGAGGGGGNVPEPATIVLAFPILAAAIKMARKSRRKSAATA